MAGWIEKLPKGYRACWRDPMGRKRSKSFARERDAKQHLRAQQVAVDRGTYIDESAGKITFADWAEHYFSLSAKTLRRTSYARDVDYMNSYVLPRWGGTRIGSISKQAVERWIVELAEDGARQRGSGCLAPATIEKIYQVFRKVMAGAVEDELIPKLPCPRSPPITRGKRKPVRFLLESEVEKLAVTINPLYEAMIFVAAYGGFRIGELCALRVNDVDWSACSVRVDEGLTDVAGHVEFEDPKTERARRSVPMADLALEKLHEHITDHVGWDDQKALLFTGSGGAVTRPNNWRKRHFNPAVDNAGLSPLTPHDLRHTAASFLIAEGANPWMVAEILGHRDTRMIDLVYGHLFEKDRQELRRRMSRRARDARQEL